MIDNAALGSRLKACRLERGLTLKAMEARAGVSATHISEIERGKTSPTIGALQKMAVALERDLAYFLESEPLEEVAHQRPYERHWHQEEGQGRWASLSPRIPASRLSTFRMELQPGSTMVASEVGESDDVFLVERGTVRFETPFGEQDLRAGDSIHLRSGTAFRFLNAGPDVAALFQFSGYRRNMPGGFVDVVGAVAGNGDGHAHGNGNGAEAHGSID